MKICFNNLYSGRDTSPAVRNLSALPALFHVLFAAAITFSCGRANLESSKACLGCKSNLPN